MKVYNLTTGQIEDRVIESAYSNSGSLIGRLIISNITPTVLKVGVNNLVGRHTLLLDNNSTFSVYFGFENDLTLETAIVIPSGSILKLKVDPKEDINLYALSDVKETRVTIIEIK